MELNKLESEILIEFYNTDMLPEMPYDIEFSKLIDKDSKYLINHNDNQNIKDIEDLIFDDNELDGTDGKEIVSQR